MNETPSQEIAIVGLSGRFPNADNLKTFWNRCCQSKGSITFFSKEELPTTDLLKRHIQSSRCVNARGILNEIEWFDHDFFQIPFLEAKLTDPQHRLFLECAFEALENGGYCPDTYLGSIGVFAGVSRSTYYLHHLLPNRELIESMGDYLIRIGNEPDFLTTKLSYKLNLKGPSLTIQTACSSSLVAICTACNYLLSYQCDMALAGGASIFVPQNSGYVYQEGMIFSPDGYCRPFDALAQGTVPSNGVGAVLLKRLDDALADRDHIYAVIKGYGLNNDGAEKMNYAAPSVKGQMSAIESALAMSQIDPRTISYAETHGTGTILGDPIEIEALSRAFRKYTQDKAYCALGSVKSNIGHCMEAAGVMGFMHATLALYEKKIPPLTHFKNPNPHINFEDSPFYVNLSLKDWAAHSSPRRACISSFGIGGTNAHLILEEAPTSAQSPKKDMPCVFVLSAKTFAALNQIALNLADCLKENPSLSPVDVAYTLLAGRKTLGCRQAFVSGNRDEIIAILQNTNYRPHSQTSVENHLTKIGNLWVSGAEININHCFSHFGGESLPSRVPLPTYPFEKKKCWIEPPTIDAQRTLVQPFIDQGQSSFRKNLAPTEQTIMKIWKGLLGVETIDRDDDFFALGGDSLLAIEAISQIEVELGAALKLQTLYEFPTIAQLSSALFQRIETIPRVVSLKNGNGPSLFLIPGVDGNNVVFNPLVDALQFKGSIFGIEAHNVGKFEKTVEEIAFSYLEAIWRLDPDGPCFLCGFSFGGIIAFEMARQLEKNYRQPSFLAIIDTINPQHPLVPRSSEHDRLVFLAEFLKGQEICTPSASQIEGLIPEILKEEILASMGLGKWPETYKNSIYEQIQKHLNSLSYYDPQTYHGDLFFFEATEAISRLNGITLSSTWKPLIKGKMQIIPLNGNHLSILKLPYVTSLANQLDSFLSSGNQSDA